MSRKDVNSTSNSDPNQPRSFLDQYTNKPTDNPGTEHKNAGDDMSLMIHDNGFLTWHQYFIAKIEHWLVLNDGGKFVPLPYLNPAKSILMQLNNNNDDVNCPLPSHLKPSALKEIKSYNVLNHRILPYHNSVHNNMDENMPNPDTSPSKPIFWLFHSFLLAVNEHWRNVRIRR